MRFPGRSVADAGLGEQVVFPGGDLGTVGANGRPVAPQAGDVQPVEGVDHVGFGRLQPVKAAVLVEGAGQLAGGNLFGHVAGQLGRAHVGAVAKRGGHVAAEGIADLGVGSGGGTEVASPAGLVGGTGQNVQQLPLRQPLVHRGL